MYLYLYTGWSGTCVQTSQPITLVSAFFVWNFQYSQQKIKKYAVQDLEIEKLKVELQNSVKNKITSLEADLQEKEGNLKDALEDLLITLPKINMIDINLLVFNMISSYFALEYYNRDELEVCQKFRKKLIISSYFSRSIPLPPTKNLRTWCEFSEIYQVMIQPAIWYYSWGFLLAGCLKALASSPA